MSVKVLGQLKPALGSGYEALYTVPASTGAVVSCFTAANLDSSTTDTVRVRIRVAGATAADKQVIAYDLPVLPNDVMLLPLMTLSAADIVEVASSQGTTSFNLFGSEFAQ